MINVEVNSEMSKATKKAGKMDKKIDIIQFKDAGAVFVDNSYYMFYQGLKTPRLVNKELDKISKNRQIHLKTRWMLLADNWMFSKNLEKALADIEEATAGIGESTAQSK